MTRRREFLRTAGLALAATASLDTAAGQAGRSYGVVSHAPNPVSRELSLQDGITYTSNRQVMVVIDFTDPE